MSGRPLKYKIIVKDNTVYKVLYNQVDNEGNKNLMECKFEEILVTLEDKYCCDGQVASVVNMPTGMIACAD